MSELRVNQGSRSALEWMRDVALRREFAIVCGLALVQFAVAWWLLEGVSPAVPDTFEYASVARNLLHGAGYTIDLVEIHAGLLPTVRHLHELHGLLQPVLIAPFFALFGTDLRWALLPTLVLAAATSMATFALGRRVGGSATGWLATAMVLSSKAFAYAAVLGADDVGWTFFSTCALAAFLAGIETERPRSSWLAGGFAGLATLQKLTGFLLPVVFSAVFALPVVRRRLGLRGWVLLVAPGMAALALYAVRNHALHGDFGFRYSPIDWLTKADPAAYFAYYEEPPTLLGVLRHIGQQRIVNLILGQLALLGETAAAEPILLVGPLALVAIHRQHATFSCAGLVYTALVVGTTCVLYHVEPRYLFALYPVYFVAVATAIVAVARKVVSRVPRVRLLLLVAVVALPCVGVRGVVVLYRTLGSRAGERGPCENSMAFLRHSMNRDDAAFTSSPWYVNWATGRAAISIPTNGVSATQTIASHYNARWLVTGLPSGFAADARATVDSLVNQGSSLRPRLVYTEAECDVYHLDGR